MATLMVRLDEQRVVVLKQLATAEKRRLAAQAELIASAKKLQVYADQWRALVPPPCAEPSHTLSQSALDAAARGGRRIVAALPTQDAATLQLALGDMTTSKTLMDAATVQTKADVAACG